MITLKWRNVDKDLWTFEVVTDVKEAVKYSIVKNGVVCGSLELAKRYKYFINMSDVRFLDIILWDAQGQEVGDKHEDF